jgi:hypothetical protein
VTADKSSTALSDRTSQHSGNSSSPGTTFLPCFEAWQSPRPGIFRIARLWDGQTGTDDSRWGLVKKGDIMSGSRSGRRELMCWAETRIFPSSSSRE